MYLKLKEVIKMTDFRSYFEKEFKDEIGSGDINERNREIVYISWLAGVLINELNSLKKYVENDDEIMNAISCSENMKSSLKDINNDLKTSAALIKELPNVDANKKVDINMAMIIISYNASNHSISLLKSLIDTEINREEFTSLLEVIDEFTRCYNNLLDTKGGK